MLVVEKILDVLQQTGIDHIFMVPGGYVDPFLSAFKKFPKIKPIIAAHEGGATFMADGYARVSGKFGVALGIGGPGVTNMTTGIANAYTDRVPLFVITGETKTFWAGRGAFQDSSLGGINDSSILSSITSKKVYLENTKTLENDLEELFRHMLGHATRGPVHLSLPADLQLLECSLQYQPNINSLHQHRIVDKNSSAKTWEYFKDANKIAILAGTGAMESQASAELIKFAEQFAIPVATTLTAKGVFPENHPLSLGVFGWFGNRRAIETLLSDELEVLIVLASRLHFADTMAWTQKLKPKKALIINDINEANIYGNYRPDLIVVGDTQEYLKTLNHAEAAQQSILESSISKRKTWISELQKISKCYAEKNLESDATPLHPARITHELQKIMPKDTVLFNGEGATNFITAHYWQSLESRKFFMPVKYLSPMGWSIAAAIGGKFATSSPVVCVIGDGSMLMHGIEIQTAARYNLPIIVIVMNNAAHGNPQLRAKTVGEYESKLLELPRHDWAAIANSLGAVGFSVTQPEELISVLQKALILNKTVLIDATVGNYPTPTEIYDKLVKEFL